MTTALILGAAVWPDGPSPTLLRRARHGAALYHAGQVSRLIACGGLGRHAPTEAESIAQVLTETGVPRAAISLEDQSTNTGTNIRNALPLLDTREVVIVTDWYHAPRARMIARRQGLIAGSSSPGIRGTRPWPQTKAVLREVPAYLVYALGLKG